jgi:hypothetical protein
MSGVLRRRFVAGSRNGKPTAVKDEQANGARDEKEGEDEKEEELTIF